MICHKEIPSPKIPLEVLNKFSKFVDYQINTEICCIFAC